MTAAKPAPAPPMTAITWRRYNAGGKSVNYTHRPCLGLRGAEAAGGGEMMARIARLRTRHKFRRWPIARPAVAAI